METLELRLVHSTPRLYRPGLHGQAAGIGVVNGALALLAPDAVNLAGTLSGTGALSAALEAALGLASTGADQAQIAGATQRSLAASEKVIAIGQAAVASALLNLVGAALGVGAARGTIGIASNKLLINSTDYLLLGTGSDTLLLD